MKKSNISRSVLDKIKAEKIAPYSRLYFIAKYSLFFVSGVLFFIIGIVATAIIWHFFHDTKLLEIFSQERALFFRGILLSFPILWFLIAILFAILVEYFAKNTKSGYKISPRNWFLTIILGQILGGLALEQSKIGKHLEHDMTRHLHIMNNREIKFRELWQNPEKGLLIGEVLTVFEKSFKLKDLDENIWEIKIDSKICKIKCLKISDKVRIIGEIEQQISKNKVFIAKKIFNRKFKRRGNNFKPNFNKDCKGHRPPKFPKN